MAENREEKRKLESELDAGKSTEQLLRDSLVRIVDRQDEQLGVLEEIKIPDEVNIKNLPEIQRVEIVNPPENKSIDLTETNKLLSKIIELVSKEKTPEDIVVELKIK